MTYPCERCNMDEGSPVCLQDERCQGRRISAPERTAWRLLERGEKIQRGDQGLNDDCETWHEVVPFVCNIPYNPGFFVPIRRKLPNTDAKGR